MTSPAEFLTRNPFWLAPMAGVNDAAFRTLCKEQGAGLTFSEMVSAKGLHYDSSNNNSRMLLRYAHEETPFVVQLFGAEPDILAEQATYLAETIGDDLAFIDINMGCPVPKVVNKGEGSALMANPDLAQEIVGAVARALEPLGKSVTVKFRKGFSDAPVDAPTFGVLMQEAGASALTVHGRTREEYYRGRSDSSVVSAVKQAVSIPVLGSGDILTPQAAVAMLLVYGADGAMIARGAQGNPWIFSQARQLYEACQKMHRDSWALDDVEEVWENAHIAAPSFEERFAMMKRHGQLIEKYFGEKSLVRMRKHAIWYCSGLPGASFFRGKIQQIASLADLFELIDEYELYLQQR